MICGIIWEDRVKLRGIEAAIGYENLAIITMKKTGKKNTNRRQPSKANPIEGSHIIKSKIGKQKS